MNTTNALAHLTQTTILQKDSTVFLYFKILHINHKWANKMYWSSDLVLLLMINLTNPGNYSQNSRQWQAPCLQTVKCQNGFKILGSGNLFRQHTWHKSKIITERLYLLQETIIFLYNHKMRWFSEKIYHLYIEGGWVTKYKWRIWSKPYPSGI
jgi:hypothetical protein